MIKLAPPNLKPDDVFELCISRVQDDELKARLESVKREVVQASEVFNELASTTRLHTFERISVIGGVVDATEMEAVYSQRMVPKKAPGRVVYDKLISQAPLGKCPLCAQRDVSTLDHHLPKSNYPILSITPLNLVPSCKDCNKAKLASTPKCANEEPLHPYFDDIDSDRWLFASVQTTTPASLIFYVEAPDSWDKVTSARVKLHFEKLGLADLYAAQGADELLNIRYQLQKLYTLGGLAAVRDDLADRAESARAVRINGWRVSAYEAFSECDWFCDGGFGVF